MEIPNIEVRDCSAFTALGTGTTVGMLWTWQSVSRLQKMQGISGLAQQVLAGLKTFRQLNTGWAKNLCWTVDAVHRFQRKPHYMYSTAAVVLLITPSLFQWPLGLRSSLVCWDCGFESRQGHGHLSLIIVVCC
jgi:hypothetical protein